MTRLSSSSACMGTPSAPAEHDPGGRPVGVDDSQWQAKHLIDAGVDVAEIQTLDDDRAGSEQHVVGGRPRLLEFLDRQVVDADHLDAMFDQMSCAGLGHAD